MMVPLCGAKVGRREIMASMIEPDGARPVPNAVHLIRTAVTTHMQLSQMADQKANMLIGASMVIFTLCIGQLRAGRLMEPIAILAVAVFLAAICAIMAVLPSVPRVGDGAVGEGDNLLFFGIFSALDEKDFTDRVMNSSPTTPACAGPCCAICIRMAGCFSAGNIAGWAMPIACFWSG